VFYADAIIFVIVLLYLKYMNIKANEVCQIATKAHLKNILTTLQYIFTSLFTVSCLTSMNVIKVQIRFHINKVHRTYYNIQGS